MRLICSSLPVNGALLYGQYDVHEKIKCFQDCILLNACQKYFQNAILQYFRPALNYHLSLRP